MAAGQFGHRSAVAAETEGFDEELVAGGVPADLLHARTGVLGLIPETFEGATTEAEHQVRFGGEYAAGDLPRAAAQFEERVFFGEVLEVAW
jgi:hypothetical protein